MAQGTLGMLSTYCFFVFQLCQELFRNSTTISHFPLPRTARQSFKKRYKTRELHSISHLSPGSTHNLPETALPEAGPFSSLLRRPCWDRPAAFFHIPHSAPCPLPRHSLPGETSPRPSLVPLPNPCSYQTPTWVLSLETFKTQPDTALSNLIQFCC